MDEFDAADVLKQTWLDQIDAIPSQEIVLRQCPYCGKSDRIRVLPSMAAGGNATEDQYANARKILATRDCKPGICGFCLNVVLVRKTDVTRVGEEESPDGD